jgi:hypothetical protein
MVLALLLAGLSPLPLPEKGVLVPVSIHVAETVDQDTVLADRVRALGRAICEHTRYVRLVKDPAIATVPFEVETYEVMDLGGGVTHHITGRYNLHGKWEPFGSWYSGVQPSTPGLGRFVETLIFDPAAIAREMRAEHDDHGRPVPRGAADVARCLADQ